jgi:hypothetical protein
MGPDELKKESRFDEPPNTESPTNDGLLLSQRGAHIERDEAAELLDKFPELALFRDSEKQTWVIDSERLARFHQSLAISPPPSSSTNDNSAGLGLFNRQSLYSPPTSTSFEKCGVESTGLLGPDVCIPSLFSPKLLEKIGATEYAALTARSTEHFDFEESAILLEEIFERKFRDEVQVLCVRIKAPEGINIDRSMSGNALLSSCNYQRDEARRAERDKVGHRVRVEQLGIEGIHQPEYVDLRHLTVLRPVFTFNRLDLSGLPLDWIKKGAPHEKRVILFEDSSQGFAIIKNGAGGIFLHSDAPIMQAAIASSDIDREDNLVDLFDSNFSQFISLVGKSRDIALYHLEEQLTSSSGPGNIHAVAQAIIEEGSEVYIKSSRTSGGKRVINVRPDEFNRPKILSDSPEVGEFLSTLVRDAAMLANREDWPPPLIDSAEKSLACTATLVDFLAALIGEMKAPIIERAIPAMRLSTEHGREKIEFRMILQGDETLKVAGHYAKASLNDVAGNISIGGYGRKTRDAIAGLYRQELGARYHDDRISKKIDETYNQLISVAEDLGNKFAKSSKEDSLDAARNMNDFAIDICPVWNQEKDSIEFYLLEIQEGYRCTALTQVEPEMAENVANFNARTKERLRKEDAEAKSLKNLLMRQRLFELGFSDTQKAPSSGQSAE